MEKWDVGIWVRVFRKGDVEDTYGAWTTHHLEE